MSKKKTHYCQLLDVGSFFDDLVEEIDWLKVRIKQSNDQHDIQQLQVKEDELQNHLLDICTPQEIEAAKQEYADRGKPKPKPARAPRERTPRAPKPKKPKMLPDRKVPKINQERRAIAAKLEKELLKPKGFKPLDLGHTIPVRIDEKTTIFIAPGDDPEEARRKYNSLHNSKRLKEKIIEK